jgi:hypothetical protein
VCVCVRVRKIDRSAVSGLGFFGWVGPSTPRSSLSRSSADAPCARGQPSFGSIVATRRSKGVGGGCISLSASRMGDEIEVQFLK